MDAEFEALIQKAFDSFMAFRPDFATVFGLHQYDTKLPSGTKDGQLTILRTFSEYLHAFQSIDAEALSPSNQIDQSLMIAVLQHQLYQEGEIRNWEKDPDCAETIGFSLVPLFSREFAPFETRLQSITARLEKSPQFIKEFKSRIKTPVPLWKDMAKESCAMLPLFFQTISYTAAQKGLDTTELDEASAKTADALTQYTDWLDTLQCGGEPVVGKEQFEGLLRARKLGLTADDILKIGEQYLYKEEKNLTMLASAIDPSLPVEKVVSNIRRDHPPTFADTLKEYEKAITSVRTLVKEKGFAAVPEGERLIVQETPIFLRHIVPIAAFVTPVEGDALAEHNYTSIINTSVHEAYPGHHLQAIWTNKNSSLARILSQAPEFTEGWAHYCEERIRDYGLTDTKVQCIQTVDIIFRAVRVIIDVNLHCGAMSFDEAVSFLESKTGIEHPTAVAEVKRYTKTPTYPLSYLLGKHLLLQLQKEVQNHMKGEYSEKVFHNTLLKAGSVPFTCLREELHLQNML
jgi:hypothetical protein